MNLANIYIEGLIKAYENLDSDYLKNDLLDFKKSAVGATDEDIKKLKEAYPDTPLTIICIFYLYQRAHEKD